MGALNGALYTSSGWAVYEIANVTWYKSTSIMLSHDKTRAAILEMRLPSFEQASSASTYSILE